MSKEHPKQFSSVRRLPAPDKALLPKSSKKKQPSIKSLKQRLEDRKWNLEKRKNSRGFFAKMICDYYRKEIEKLEKMIAKQERQ